MTGDPADVREAQRSASDVCMCGDRRDQHRDGKFECLLHDLCTPFRCRLFRLCWTKAEHEASEGKRRAK